MRQDDDIIRALAARLVNGGLYAGVQQRAVRILIEGVDEFARVVLEIDRRRGGDGLGRGNADKGDLYPVELHHLIGGEERLARGEVAEIAADVGVLRQLRQLKHARGAIVKLMVADGGHVVADAVHDLDDRLALRERADGGALQSVAAVRQNNVAAGRLKLLFQRSKPGIANVVVHAAVNVVGIENNKVPRKRRRRGLLGGGGRFGGRGDRRRCRGAGGGEQE